MPKKIITCEVFPPIPTTDFDYCAYYEGDEELQDYGWGSTRNAAIADLKEQFATNFYPSKPIEPSIDREQTARIRKTWENN